MSADTSLVMSCGDAVACGGGPACIRIAIIGRIGIRSGTSSGPRPAPPWQRTHAVGGEMHNLLARQIVSGNCYNRTGLLSPPVA